MKTVALLCLIIAASLLVGCSTDRCTDCACLQGNCCGWEFYKPCPLIRPDATCDDAAMCPTDVIIMRDGQPCAPPAEAAPAPAPEAAPAAIEVAPAGDPVASYGGG